MRSKAEPLSQIREFLEVSVRPFLQGATILDLFFLSLFAGIGEELLFRGVLQGALSMQFGTLFGLIIASLLFGLGHWITRSYALIASLIGLYLGYLWLLTSNLLVPIVTHALYDFVALLIFLKAMKERPTVIPR